jgi:hypothetical protein
MQIKPAAAAPAFERGEYPAGRTPPSFYLQIYEFSGRIALLALFFFISGGNCAVATACHAALPSSLSF